MSSSAVQLSREASPASVSTPAASRTITKTSASTSTSSMTPSSAISAISAGKSVPAVSLTICQAPRLQRQLLFQLQAPARL
ncbi:hypothetical protein PPTG_22591 [Phytophthora nicotianae INRA-310]|uniref:Uncharacterized protein n=1 Tax=Phytophthora nicotianae (strain INRA-310) TaxID=761204 RepID=W2QG63_PHYN3|nr:hypothetical protein PPTG_22591 [Phytophthora nicotianae INRA-310]ETN11499.1 hypothetical protein PPTG_22591 [Phytophthora nicotianae INRA-310]